MVWWKNVSLSPLLENMAIVTGLLDNTDHLVDFQDASCEQTNTSSCGVNLASYNWDCSDPKYVAWPSRSDLVIHCRYQLARISPSQLDFTPAILPSVGPMRVTICEAPVRVSFDCFCWFF